MAKKQILLPRNGCGVLIMLLVMVLLFTVPAALVYWLISLIAPWWVALPFSIAAGTLALLLNIKHTP